MATRSTVSFSRPGFIADWGSVRRNSGRQIDWALVGEKYRTTPGQIVKMAAAALADATSLTVDPLEQAVPAGTLLYFGQAGEHTRVSANAAAGATTLAVEAPHGAIEDNDEATIVGSGDKFIPAGTPMDEIDATGLMIPRAAGANVAGRTTIGLIISDAHENQGPGFVESLSGYGVFSGAVVYEELLPVTIDADARTALLALPGGGIAFETYEDDRAT